ncbi:hypothetical protein [Sphingomonas sp. Leaf4]|uniref:hypothetical protein n=1 Tax=Sphingomonas sp. Leaf4 TaxID=2876553 RepID=UPI001E4B094C|nr:hypothetical protein [Sphingomonas sp. Leaf4]
MVSLYDYLDQHVRDMADDDIFVLSAARTWVFAVRNARCPQAMLRSGFTVRRVGAALLPFLCSMTLIDRYGYGTMRFAAVRYSNVSDDEARILTLFGAAQEGDPRLIRIATSLVSDEMAMQLAGAASKVGAALLPTN